MPLEVSRRGQHNRPNAEEVTHQFCLVQVQLGSLRNKAHRVGAFEPAVASQEQLCPSGVRRHDDNLQMQFLGRIAIVWSMMSRQQGPTAGRLVPAPLLRRQLIVQGQISQGGTSSHRRHNHGSTWYSADLRKGAYLVQLVVRELLLGLLLLLALPWSRSPILPAGGGRSSVVCRLAAAMFVLFCSRH